MLSAILFFGIGLFVGWNIPMPPKAQLIQDKVLGFFKRSTPAS